MTLRWQKVMRFVVCSVALLSLAALQLSQGQGTWEMRVCTDAHDFPVSSQERKGFDNRIAEILADELGAKLTYLWTVVSGPEVVRRHLRTGDCDLIMGVADGVMGLLNTVPYYRVPYAFVYRQDGDFELNSLEDEVLSELRISTYPAGVPYNALLNQGLRENIVLQRPVAGVGGPDRFSPMVGALLEGEVDVVIADGTDAGLFVQQHPEELKLVSVSPEIMPSGLQMSRTLTIGVRPGDEALRDRLNIALAQRWDDIQAVFGAYGIPLSPLPQPLAPLARETEPIRVGAVLPMPTGNPAMTDTIGEAARVGAELAEDLIGREAAQSGNALEVLLANSPSEEAARRAAQRLVSTEGVTALVGGLEGDLEEGQARVLSEVAEARGVLFFNIGSPLGVLRGEACRRNTFHIEASAAMYLDGLTEWFTDLGHQNWFFVYEGSEAGRALYEQAKGALTEEDGESEEVGSAELAPGPGAYGDVFDRIREAAPDIVLLLLEPEAQELFLSQYAFEGFDVPITGFPFPVMQTRDFLVRLRQVAPTSSLQRLALWETTLEDDGAGDLNERFISRSGEPMDPAGWAAYAAVKVLYEAVAATESRDTSTLVAFLESPEAVFDLHKGPGTSFRPWDHQLRQPLYVVGIDPEAAWGRQVSARVAFAEGVGEVPTLDTSGADSVERLDLLGDGADESNCRF